jgi:hypothetical protein
MMEECPGSPPVAYNAGSAGTDPEIQLLFPRLWRDTCIQIADKLQKSGLHPVVAQYLNLDQLEKLDLLALIQKMIMMYFYLLGTAKVTTFGMHQAINFDRQQCELLFTDHAAAVTYFRENYGRETQYLDLFTIVSIQDLSCKDEAVAMKLINFYYRGMVPLAIRELDLDERIFLATILILYFSFEALKVLMDTFQLPINRPILLRIIEKLKIYTECHVPISPGQLIQTFKDFNENILHICKVGDAIPKQLFQLIESNFIVHRREYYTVAQQAEIERSLVDIMMHMGKMTQDDKDYLRKKDIREFHSKYLAMASFHRIEVMAFKRELRKLIATIDWLKPRAFGLKTTTSKMLQAIHDKF